MRYLRVLVLVALAIGWAANAAAADPVKPISGELTVASLIDGTALAEKLAQSRKPKTILALTCSSNQVKCFCKYRVKCCSSSCGRCNSLNMPTCK